MLIQKKSTASNLSSRLLQLPQELKNQIYKYLIGGKCIHVEERWTSNAQKPYFLYLCRATVTTSSAQQIFDAATNIDAVHEVEKEHEDSDPGPYGLDKEIQDDNEDDTYDDVDDETNTSKFVCVDTHRRCYCLSTLRLPRSCMTTRRQRMPPIQTLMQSPQTMQTPGKPDLVIRGEINPPLSPQWLQPQGKPLARETIHLPVHLLRTCRQMHHDMNNIIYSANTFSFEKPVLLTRFGSNPGSKTLAIRRLHLHITVHDEIEESKWNRAFRTAARRFRNLSSVDISIDQGIWNRDMPYPGSRENPSMSEQNTFLVGMSELKKLKFLREMTLVVTDVYPWEVWAPSKTLWSDTQKQKWVRDVRADILGRGKGLGKA